MRTTKYILGMVLTAAVLLTGCEFDDKELWGAVNDQAARIAALEKWQTTVNGNISTLQELVSASGNNDYVTGVTPFTTPAPGGYTITFTKNSPITLYHGTNGADGKDGQDGSTPVIGVDEYPSGSGVYYWTLNGEWLTAGGKKMAVTGEKGADGATPKLTIGSDDYWYISATGTATGTAPGTGWVSTGVKATGATGATGGTGSAGSGIFKSVDNSHPDHVAFTLTNGKTFTLLKHKAMGIRFDAPGVFMANGEPQVIPYTLTGTEEPSAIWVANTPPDWTISIDTELQKITITPPSEYKHDPDQNQPTLLIADGDRVTAMYRLVLKIINKNVLGGNYYENSVSKGIVYIPAGTFGDGTGRILHFKEAQLNWATKENKDFQTGCSSHTNGYENMVSMSQFIAKNGKSWSDFPAFEWIHAMNGSNTHYTSGAKGLWYMPSPAELNHLLCVAAGKGLETWGFGDNYNNPTFYPGDAGILDLSDFNDNKLVHYKAAPLSQGYVRYQSSRERSSGNYDRVWNLSFRNGEYLENDKDGSDKATLYTRAILAF